MNVLVDDFDVFAKGFLITFQICVLSGLFALLLGTLVATMRISPLPPLRWLGTAYVTVFRNLPLTVVSFFAAFTLPQLGTDAGFLKIPGFTLLFERLGADLPYFRFFVLALGFYTAAFVCEAIRSGVNAVPAGQAEAARSIGLTFTQNLRHVVMPQAWQYSVVPLGSVIIAMIKNSALGGFFGITGDLSHSGERLVINEGQPVLSVFFGVGLGFLVMTVPLGLLLDRVERRRAVT